MRIFSTTIKKNIKKKSVAGDDSRSRDRKVRIFFFWPENLQFEFFPSADVDLEKAFDRVPR